MHGAWSLRRTRNWDTGLCEVPKRQGYMGGPESLRVPVYIFYILDCSRNTYAIPYLYRVPEYGYTR